MLISFHYMFQRIKKVSTYSMQICSLKLKGAVLVNAARGAVIDTAALINAVNDGIYMVVLPF